MRAGIEEAAEMWASFRKNLRIGDADAIESERTRLACERGLQIGGREF
jgi:hypothetical protein